LRAGERDDDKRRLTPKIGWIGIGRMGYAMAERLASRRRHHRRNRTAPRPRRSRRRARRSPDVDQLAACDIVFVMVSAWKDVESVIMGPSGCSVQLR
jgi:3-hydroxyisobutyrate dehydrogenase